MSISQIKKRFEEFETYLGRDKVGLEKLKELKDSVNWLRKALASAQGDAETQRSRSEELRLRVRDLESENTEAAIAIQRHSQITDSLNRELAALKASVTADAEETIEVEQSLQYKDTEIAAALKGVRRRLRYCPKPTGVCNDRSLPSEAKVMIYDRESIAEGWTHDAIWTLGASVALISYFLGVCIITTDKTQRTCFDGGIGSQQKVGQEFLVWTEKSHEEILSVL